MLSDMEIVTKWKIRASQCEIDGYGRRISKYRDMCIIAKTKDEAIEKAKERFDVVWLHRPIHIEILFSEDVIING